MAQRRALLIAVPEYRDDAIDSFPEVVRNDINELEASLHGSGYRQVTIRGIDNIWEATRPQIVDELERFFRNATSGDTLFTYLSGHGLHHNGRDYLVPTEAVVRNPEKFDDFLIRIDFSHLIQDSRAETVVIFVDACRQGVKLKHKASYTVGWGMGHRAKVKRQCYVIIFACSAGEFAQYVTGKDTYSLFTRALSDVICRDYSAQTLGDVLRASSDRLAELIEMHGKRPQNIRKVFESDVDEDAALSRAICDGPSGTQSPIIATNPWCSAALSSEIWVAENLNNDVAIPPLKDSVGEIVNVCWQQWERTVKEVPDDTWRDKLLPIRVLNNLSLLLYRSDPRIQLSAGECSLVVIAPFVREAIISAGTRRAATAKPFSLDITGETETGPRSELEKTFEAYPQLVRKSKRLEALGKEDARKALAAWLMYRSVLRVPQIWLPHPIGDMPQEMQSVLNRQAEHQSPVVADTLTAGRITEFARCIFGDPERVERHDRTNALKDELYLGGQSKERCVREKLLAYLLILSGQLAIDSRLLSSLLVDHLGLADPVTPSDIIETIRSIRWTTGGRALNLSVTCSHQAMDLALRDHVREASNILETIIAKSDTTHPSLYGMNGLPIRLTPDEIRPASDDNDNPVYQIPHIRFHLAQDEVRELLMGTQLYGDPTLAIRELYQNALDACRYRRARLDYLRASKQLNPVLADWEGCIEFRQGFDEAGRPYIECSDNGIGMARRELSECFARAGRRFHDTPEFIEEQAEWRKYGVELFPNSQFGIGVFSYFMLADELEIETCRLDRRGVPGNRLTARVSGTGTLFRIVEKANSGSDAGTRIRLYLNRTKYKSRYHEERISCLNTLRKLLWVAEFCTHVDEGADSFRWEPGFLYHPEMDPTMWVEGSSASLWWVTKGSRGHISAYRRVGAILSDGIYAEPDDISDTPLTFIVNLTESHRPNLSVNRKKILAWDKLWVEQLLGESWVSLIDWPRLSLSWLWLLVRESRETAEQLTAALVERNMSLNIGHVSWHVNREDSYYESSPQDRLLEFNDSGWVHQNIRIREVGCFPSDIGLFQTIDYNRLHLEGLLENLYRHSRRGINPHWECPDWLKPDRLKIWKSSSSVTIPVDLSRKYDDGSPSICPTLFPKDEKLLRNMPKDVSYQQLLKFASLTGETLAATITRLQRLSPLGFNTPDVNLDEVGELTVSKNEMTSITDDGQVTLVGLLKAVSESGKTVAEEYEALSRFKTVGIQLPDIDDLSVIANAKFNKNDLNLLDDNGRITNVQVLKVAADTGQPIRFLNERIHALCEVGIPTPELDLVAVADITISKDDFESIRRSKVEPFAIVKLSANRSESIGTTLRRLKRFELFGIQIPNVNPAEFDKCTLSKEELDPFKYIATVTMSRLLNIAATLNEPVKATISRWQKLIPLGIEIPEAYIADIPDDLTFTKDDLKVLIQDDTITISSILKAAAQIGEPVYKTIKRARKFGSIGIDLPKVEVPDDWGIFVTDDDLRVLNNVGEIDVISILKASAALGEAVSITYMRACKLKGLGLQTPQLAKEDIEGLVLSTREAAVLSQNKWISPIGILWVSAETGTPIATILKRLKRLSKFGIRLPSMRLTELGANTVNVDDLKALSGAVLLNMPGWQSDDVNDVRLFLRERWHWQYDESTPEGLKYLYNYEETGRLSNILMMSNDVDKIADAMGEPTETTASRLKRLAIILGLFE